MESGDKKVPSKSEADVDSAAVEVVVKGLVLDPATNTPIVVLRHEASERFLPIWIGEFEAHAIALVLEEIDVSRPLSHDVMASLVTTLDGHVEQIVISDLQEGTFFAQIFLRQDDVETVLDVRPSDAIALGLRLGSPIFVSEHVFEDARNVDLSNRLTDEEKVRKWLEDIDPGELGKYTM